MDSAGEGEDNPMNHTLEEGRMRRKQSDMISHSDGRKGRTGGKKILGGRYRQVHTFGGGKIRA